MWRHLDLLLYKAEDTLIWKLRVSSTDIKTTNSSSSVLSRGLLILIKWIMRPYSKDLISILPTGVFEIGDDLYAFLFNFLVCYISHFIKSLHKLFKRVCTRLSVIEIFFIKESWPFCNPMFENLIKITVFSSITTNYLRK